MAAWGLLVEMFYSLSHSGAGINMDYLSIMYRIHITSAEQLRCIHCPPPCYWRENSGWAAVSSESPRKGHLARKPEADTVHVLVWSDRSYHVERDLPFQLGSNITFGPLAKYATSPHVCRGSCMSTYLPDVCLSLVWV